MAQHDVDFDVAAARAWKREVDNEIIKVEGLLDRLAAVTAELPDDDDTVLQKLKEIGDMERTAWKGMCNVFKEVGNALGELINGREKKIQDMSDKASAHKSSFHL